MAADLREQAPAGTNHRALRAHGQFLPAAHGHHAATGPVAALDAWLQMRGTTPGPVFVSLCTGALTTVPISGEAIAWIPRSRARASGIPVDRIARQTRHRRIATPIDGWVRPAKPSTSPPAETSASRAVMPSAQAPVSG